MAKFDLKSLLSEKSLSKEKMIEGVAAPREVFKVVSLSIYDLVPSEDNFYSVENIQELKDAIELFGGVKQNLIVKRLENSTYKIIAGHKRRLASLALVEEGKKEFEFVPCVIEEDIESIEEKLLLIMTNSTARQLTDYEKAKQVEEIKKLLIEYKKQEKISGRIRDLIAEILGTSPTQIGRLEATSNNLIDEFKKEWKEEKVSSSTAYEVSTLTEEQQKEAYEQHREKGGISLNEVKEIKKKQTKQTEEEEIEPPLKGQVGFYEEELPEPYEEEQEDEKVSTLQAEAQEEGCGFCKRDYHTSIITEEGNYLIDIDSENKMARVMRRGYDAEIIAFVFCPMCGRKI